MIQHLQNSLPVLILSTPYSVLEYSMLSTGVFHTMYWSIPYYVLQYSILSTGDIQHLLLKLRKEGDTKCYISTSHRWDEPSTNKRNLYCFRNYAGSCHSILTRGMEGDFWKNGRLRVYLKSWISKEVRLFCFIIVSYDCISQQRFAYF